MAVATIFYTLEDADGDKSRVEIPVTVADLLDADIDFVVGAAWDIINPLVNGHLVTAGFTIEVDISGFTNAAVATIADVQEKAEFAFRTVTGFIKRISLPTFIETFFTSAGAGKDVDTSATEVAAFNSMIIDGIPDAVVVVTPVPVVDLHGDDVDTFVKAHQTWGKNRK